MGFNCTKLRLRPFSAASMRCTERVPKPEMHSMERLELYLWCLGKIKASLCILAFSTRRGANVPQTVVIINALWQRCVAAANAPYPLTLNCARSDDIDDKCASALPVKLPCARHIDLVRRAARSWIPGPPLLAVGCNLFISFSEMSKTQKYSFLLYCAPTEYSRLL